MLYKTDYHVHTSYSDGKADPAEYIASAIASGLNEIGFSEHLNLINEKQKREIHGTGGFLVRYF